MKKIIINKLKTLSERADKWLAKASTYMYNFKDGHFQFPYASNDPELMIEALKNTPFVVHDEQMQCLETNSAFMKIKLKYLQMEDGLWMTSTQSNWKVNVVAIAISLEQPSDYYFLTYSRLTDHVNVVLKDGEHLFENNSHSWTFYKSTTALDAYFQKKCKAYAVVFMLHKKWIVENILNTNNFNYDKIYQLLDAENAYKTYIYNDSLIDNKFNDFNTILNDVPVDKIDIEALKRKSVALIQGFFENISLEKPINAELETVKTKDRTKIERIEKLLNQTLTTGFLGIEKISEEFEISPTKLKTDFKTVFGMSLLQYYQKKQMELSIELIKNKLSMQQIADILGFVNKSKFSAKFKETYGVLPSKYF